LFLKQDYCNPKFYPEGGMNMKGLKGLIIAATIVGTVATLGACRREVRHEPMKLGGDIAPVEQAIR